MVTGNLKRDEHVMNSGTQPAASNHSGTFSKFKPKLVVGYQAVVYAFGLLLLCGAMSWQTWYSPFPHNRLQTEALLRGELALSHNPSNLGHDLCWSQGGVHQVWGLGIAFWQLPFEALARAFSMAPFPDRIALALFIALAAYTVMWIWFGPQSNQDPKHASEKPKKTVPGQRLVAAGSVILILLFPPLLNLLRYRMWVYEEVMVYVYFFGVLLMSGLIVLKKNPKWTRFWLLCVFAGLGGFLRPTLVFYGFATVAIALLIMICHERTQPSNTFKPMLLRASLGALLFVCGGALLFITNYLRFGSGWQFGHDLNLQKGSLLASVYSTRFNFPFLQASLKESARELLGALFCVNSFNGMNWYSSDVVAGQSPVFRWREFSFSTYDVFYAAGIALAWMIGTWAAWKCLRRSHSREAISSRFQRMPPHILMILWSVAASAPLFGFYLKVPAIASRYMLDFAPAFIAALVGLWSWTVERILKQDRYPKRIALYLFAAVVLWQGSEISLAQRMDWPPQTLTREAARAQIEAVRQAPTPSSDNLPHSEYSIGNLMDASDIPYDGEGWDSTNGAIRLCAIFFVRSPQFLELELAAAPGSYLTTTSLTNIQAKVGLEFLKRDSITSTNGGWILHFAGPKNSRYQEGLQPVFLAMVPSTEIAQYVGRPSPWILKRLRWHKE